MYSTSFTDRYSQGQTDRQTDRQSTDGQTGRHRVCFLPLVFGGGVRDGFTPALRRLPCLNVLTVIMLRSVLDTRCFYNADLFVAKSKGKGGGSLREI